MGTPKSAEDTAAEGGVVCLHDISFWYPGAPPAESSLVTVRLSIREGEFALVCGPSGSGKSTLLRLCLGLVPQFTGGRLSGTVTVLGRDPTTVRPRELAAAGVGLLFQNPVEGFVEERVGAEVAFGPQNLGLPVEEIDRRIAESLSAVGMGGFEERRLRDLSAGQQQRVALAAALALRPRLLLLDEPTAHLDEETARSILALISRVHQDLGATVIMSEHRLARAAPLVDRVVVLAAGRLVGNGPPSEALGRPELSGLGVPVPRVTQAALQLGWHLPVPLSPQQFAGRVLAERRTGIRPSSFAVRREGSLLDGRPGTEKNRRITVAFDDVGFTYPRGGFVIAGLSFTLCEGETVALVGPSGAGKSTVARLALGLLKPARGWVALCGLPTDRTPFGTLAAAGGLVLQNPLLQLLAERVDEELLLGLRDVPPQDAQQRTDALLRAFGLEGLRARHPLRLSEGQRRRVALAAVLARRPKVLIMDEPTLGQDELERASLVRLTRDLAEAGATVLAISHDVEFVNDACERALVLHDGRLVADVPMSLARDDPGRLHSAGVPLAEIPETALELSVAGWPVRARRLPELLAAIS
ncbi:MAG: ATP-binding cassette domain-containing protein [Chloroflexi bacterium]|nr:ATP-binding cassette domain-containing protein [Chloroflexota bacterium]